MADAADLASTYGTEKSPLLDHSEAITSEEAAKNSSVSTNVSAKHCKIYKRRWYVLGMFTAIATINNMDWNTFGPISQPCQIVFGWENWHILFLSCLIAICVIAGAIPITWLMERKGLRLSVMLCAFVMTLGKAIQLIPTENNTLRLVLMNIGQAILMIGVPVAIGAPPAVSATWFPLSERNTATAISTLAAYFGVALSFAIGPAMAPVVGPSVIPGNSSNNSSNVKYYSDEDKKAMELGIRNFFLLQLAVSGFLFLCILVYFPNKPPIPPSITSVKPHMKYSDGLKRLCRNRSYWLLALIFAVSIGVYFGWLVVFALAVKPFNIGETEAGWLGCAGTTAGIFSGILLARCADYVQRYTKHMLIILFIGTSIAQLFFSLTCSKIIPYSQAVLFASIIIGGLFFNGTTPLLFELSMECVYPVGEGTTATMLLAAANVVYLAFQVAFMFPVVSVKWMNWFTVAATGICAPLLMCYKNTFSRLNLDLGQGECTEDDKDVKKQGCNLITYWY